MLFDGNSGLRAKYTVLESTAVPIADTWEFNFAMAEWTFGMWFNLKEMPSSSTHNDMTLISFEIN